MVGLRFYFNERHKREWVTDGTLDWLWPAAERAGVPVALAAALFLPTVGQIAERHPGLKLTVDHMAVPPGSKGEAAYRFQPELLALAKYPNVAVKATGQAGYASDGYPFRSFHEHLHRCFDAFGPERLFWGTDITRMPCSWRQCVTLFTEELPWLKGRDLGHVRQAGGDSRLKLRRHECSGRGGKWSAVGAVARSAIDGMADCAAAGAPLSSPAPEGTPLRGCGA